MDKMYSTSVVYYSYTVELHITVAPSSGNLEPLSAADCCEDLQTIWSITIYF